MKRETVSEKRKRNNPSAFPVYNKKGSAYNILEAGRRHKTDIKAEYRNKSKGTDAMSAYSMEAENAGCDM